MTIINKRCGYKYLYILMALLVLVLSTTTVFSNTCCHLTGNDEDNCGLAKTSIFTDSALTTLITESDPNLISSTVTCEQDIENDVPAVQPGCCILKKPDSTDSICAWMDASSDDINELGSKYACEGNYFATDGDHYLISGLSEYRNDYSESSFRTDMDKNACLPVANPEPISHLGEYGQINCLDFSANSGMLSVKIINGELPIEDLVLTVIGLDLDNGEIYSKKPIEEDGWYNYSVEINKNYRVSFDYDGKSYSNNIYVDENKDLVFDLASIIDYFDIEITVISDADPNFKAPFPNYLEHGIFVDGNYVDSCQKIDTDRDIFNCRVSLDHGQHTIDLMKNFSDVYYTCSGPESISTCEFTYDVQGIVKVTLNDKLLSKITGTVDIGNSGEILEKPVSLFLYEGSTECNFERLSDPDFTFSDIMNNQDKNNGKFELYFPTGESYCLFFNGNGEFESGFYNNDVDVVDATTTTVSPNDVIKINAYSKKYEFMIEVSYDDGNLVEDANCSLAKSQSVIANDYTNVNGICGFSNQDYSDKGYNIVSSCGGDDDFCYYWPSFHFTMGSKIESQMVFEHTLIEKKFSDTYYVIFDKECVEEKGLTLLQAYSQKLCLVEDATVTLESSDKRPYPYELKNDVRQGSTISSQVSGKYYDGTSMVDITPTTMANVKLKFESNDYNGSSDKDIVRDITVFSKDFSKKTTSVTFKKNQGNQVFFVMLDKLPFDDCSNVNTVLVDDIVPVKHNNQVMISWHPAYRENCDVDTFHVYLYAEDGLVDTYEPESNNDYVVVDSLDWDTNYRVCILGDYPGVNPQFAAKCDFEAIIEKDTVDGVKFAGCKERPDVENPGEVKCKYGTCYDPVNGQLTIDDENKKSHYYCLNAGNEVCSVDYTYYMNDEVYENTEFCYSDIINTKDINNPKSDIDFAKNYRYTCDDYNRVVFADDYLRKDGQLLYTEDCNDFISGDVPTSCIRTKDNNPNDKFGYRAVCVVDMDCGFDFNDDQLGLSYQKDRCLTYPEDDFFGDTISNYCYYDTSISNFGESENENNLFSKQVNFKDSVTVVDECIDCNSVGGSCYDYKSSASCVKDSCSYGQGNGCVWEADGDFNDLGFGVCKPKEEKYSKCDTCFDPTNSYLVPCDENRCHSLGPDASTSEYGCYFDGEESMNDILNKNLPTRRKYADKGNDFGYYYKYTTSHKKESDELNNKVKYGAFDHNCKSCQDLTCYDIDSVDELKTYDMDPITNAIVTTTDKNTCNYNICNKDATSVFKDGNNDGKDDCNRLDLSTDEKESCQYDMGLPESIFTIKEPLTPSDPHISLRANDEKAKVKLVYACIDINDGSDSTSRCDPNDQSIIDYYKDNSALFTTGNENKCKKWDCGKQWNKCYTSSDNSSISPYQVYPPFSCTEVCKQVETTCGDNDDNLMPFYFSVKEDDIKKRSIYEDNVFDYFTGNNFDLDVSEFTREGTNYIRYFAVDENYNFEVLNEQAFFVDTIGPSIEIEVGPETSYGSYLLTANDTNCPDEKQSDGTYKNPICQGIVGIDFSVTVSDITAVCDVHMYQGQTPEDLIFGSQLNGDFQRSQTKLLLGGETTEFDYIRLNNDQTIESREYYMIDVICADSNGNMERVSKSVYADSNTYINEEKIVDSSTNPKGPVKEVWLTKTIDKTKYDETFKVNNVILIPGSDGLLYVKGETDSIIPFSNVNFEFTTKEQSECVLNNISGSELAKISTSDYLSHSVSLSKLKINDVADTAYEFNVTCDYNKDVEVGSPTLGQYLNTTSNVYSFYVDSTTHSNSVFQIAGIDFNSEDDWYGQGSPYGVSNIIFNAVDAPSNNMTVFSIKYCIDYEKDCTPDKELVYDLEKGFDTGNDIKLSRSAHVCYSSRDHGNSVEEPVCKFVKIDNIPPVFIMNYDNITNKDKPDISGFVIDYHIMSKHNTNLTIDPVFNTNFEYVIDDFLTKKLEGNGDAVINYDIPFENYTFGISIDNFKDCYYNADEPSYDCPRKDLTFTFGDDVLVIDNLIYKVYSQENLQFEDVNKASIEFNGTISYLDKPLNSFYLLVTHTLDTLDVQVYDRKKQTTYFNDDLVNSLIFNKKIKRNDKATNLEISGRNLDGTQIRDVAFFDHSGVANNTLYLSTQPVKKVIFDYRYDFSLISWKNEFNGIKAFDKVANKYSTQTYKNTFTEDFSINDSNGYGGAIIVDQYGPELIGFTDKTKAHIDLPEGKKQELEKIYGKNSLTNKPYIDILNDFEFDITAIDCIGIDDTFEDKLCTGYTEYSSGLSKNINVVIKNNSNNNHVFSVDFDLIEISETMSSNYALSDTVDNTKYGEGKYSIRVKNIENITHFINDNVTLEVFISDAFGQTTIFSKSLLVVDLDLVSMQVEIFNTSLIDSKVSIPLKPTTNCFKVSASTNEDILKLSNFEMLIDSKLNSEKYPLTIYSDDDCKNLAVPAVKSFDKEAISNFSFKLDQNYAYSPDHSKISIYADMIDKDGAYSNKVKLDKDYYFYLAVLDRPDVFDAKRYINNSKTVIVGTHESDSVILNSVVTKNKISENVVVSTVKEIIGDQIFVDIPFGNNNFVGFDNSLDYDNGYEYFGYTYCGLNGANHCYEFERNLKEMPAVGSKISVYNESYVNDVFYFDVNLIKGWNSFNVYSQDQLGDKSRYPTEVEIFYNDYGMNLEVDPKDDTYHGTGRVELSAKIQLAKNPIKLTNFKLVIENESNVLETLELTDFSVLDLRKDDFIVNITKLEYDDYNEYSFEINKENGFDEGVYYLSYIAQDLSKNYVKTKIKITVDKARPNKADLKLYPVLVFKTEVCPSDSGHPDHADCIRDISGSWASKKTTCNFGATCKVIRDELIDNGTSKWYELEYYDLGNDDLFIEGVNDELRVGSKNIFIEANFNDNSLYQFLDFYLLNLETDEVIAVDTEETKDLNKFVFNSSNISDGNYAFIYEVGKNISGSPYLYGDSVEFSSNIVIDTKAPEINIEQSIFEYCVDSLTQIEVSDESFIKNITYVVRINNTDLFDPVNYNPYINRSDLISNIYDINLETEAYEGRCYLSYQDDVFNVSDYRFFGDVELVFEVEDNLSNKREVIVDVEVRDTIGPEIKICQDYPCDVNNLKPILDYNKFYVFVSDGFVNVYTKEYSKCNYKMPGRGVNNWAKLNPDLFQYSHNFMLNELEPNYEYDLFLDCIDENNMNREEIFKIEYDPYPVDISEFVIEGPNVVEGLNGNYEIVSTINNPVDPLLFRMGATLTEKGGIARCNYSIYNSSNLLFAKGLLSDGEYLFNHDPLTSNSNNSLDGGQVYDVYLTCIDQAGYTDTTHKVLDVKPIWDRMPPEFDAYVVNLKDGSKVSNIGGIYSYKLVVNVTLEKSGIRNGWLDSYYDGTLKQQIYFDDSSYVNGVYEIPFNYNDIFIDKYEGNAYLNVTMYDIANNKNSFIVNIKLDSLPPSLDFYDYQLPFMKGDDGVWYVNLDDVKIVGSIDNEDDLFFVTKNGVEYPVLKSNNVPLKKYYVTSKPVVGSDEVEINDDGSFIYDNSNYYLQFCDAKDNFVSSKLYGDYYKIISSEEEGNKVIIKLGDDIETSVSHKGVYACIFEKNAFDNYFAIDTIVPSLNPKTETIIPYDEAGNQGLPAEISFMYAVLPKFLHWSPYTDSTIFNKKPDVKAVVSGTGIKLIEISVYDYNDLSVPIQSYSVDCNGDNYKSGRCEISQTLSELNDKKEYFMELVAVSEYSINVTKEIRFEVNSDVANYPTIIPHDGIKIFDNVACLGDSNRVSFIFVDTVSDVSLDSVIETSVYSSKNNNYTYYFNFENDVTLNASLNATRIVENEYDFTLIKDTKAPELIDYKDYSTQKDGIAIKAEFEENCMMSNVLVKLFNEDEDECFVGALNPASNNIFVKDITQEDLTSCSLTEGTYTIMYEAYDVLDNKKIFEETYSVVDVTAPSILNVSPHTVDSTNMDYRAKINDENFKFSVETDELSTCYLYDPIKLNKIQMQTQNGLVHDLSLLLDFTYDDYKYYEIECNDHSNKQHKAKVNYMITYDNKKPSFSLSVDPVMIDQTGIYVSGTYLDSNLVIDSNEPVLCRLTRSIDDTYNYDGFNLSEAYDIFKSDMVNFVASEKPALKHNIPMASKYKGLALQDGLILETDITYTYYAICKDESGNFASDVASVKFSTDEDKQLSIYDESPVSYSQTLDFNFTFRSARPASCTLETEELKFLGDKNSFVQNSNSEFKFAISNEATAIRLDLLCEEEDCGESCSNNFEKTYTVKIDTIPPSLSITNIDNGSVLSTTSKLVKGIISDDQSDKIYIDVYRNDILIDIVLFNSGSFNYDLYVGEGENDLRFVARDLAGNTNELEYDLIVKLSSVCFDVDMDGLCDFDKSIDLGGDNCSINGVKGIWEPSCDYILENHNCICVPTNSNVSVIDLFEPSVKTVSVHTGDILSRLDDVVVEFNDPSGVLSFENTRINLIFENTGDVIEAKSKTKINGVKTKVTYPSLNNGDYLIEIIPVKKNNKSGVINGLIRFEIDSLVPYINYNLENGAKVMEPHGVISGIVDCIGDCRNIPNQIGDVVMTFNDSLYGVNERMFLQSSSDKSIFDFRNEDVYLHKNKEVVDNYFRLNVTDVSNKIGSKGLVVYNDDKAPVISLSTPKDGYTKDKNPIIVLQTDEVAVCKYDFKRHDSFMDYKYMFGNDLGATYHVAQTYELNLNNSKERLVYFMCVDYDSYIGSNDLQVSEMVKTFRYDTGILDSVNITLEKEIILDYDYDNYGNEIGLSNKLFIEASKDVLCRVYGDYEVSTPYYDKDQTIELNNLVDQKTYELLVVCSDKAHTNYDSVKLSFEVDTKKPLFIEEIEIVDSKIVEGITYTNNNHIEFLIKTNRKAVCAGYDSRTNDRNLDFDNIISKSLTYEALGEKHKYFVLPDNNGLYHRKTITIEGTFENDAFTFYFDCKPAKTNVINEIKASLNSIDFNIDNIPPVVMFRVLKDNPIRAGMLPIEIVTEDVGDVNYPYNNTKILVDQYGYIDTVGDIEENLNKRINLTAKTFEYNYLVVKDDLPSYEEDDFIDGDASLTLVDGTDRAGNEPIYMNNTFYIDSLSLKPIYNVYDGGLYNPSCLEGITIKFENIANITSIIFDSDMDLRSGNLIDKLEVYDNDKVFFLDIEYFANEKYPVYDHYYMDVEFNDLNGRNYSEHLEFDLGKTFCQNIETQVEFSYYEKDVDVNYAGYNLTRMLKPVKVDDVLSLFANETPVIPSEDIIAKMSFFYIDNTSGPVNTSLDLDLDDGYFKVSSKPIDDGVHTHVIEMKDLYNGFHTMIYNVSGMHDGKEYTAGPFVRTFVVDTIAPNPRLYTRSTKAYIEIK